MVLLNGLPGTHINELAVLLVGPHDLDLLGHMEVQFVSGLRALLTLCKGMIHSNQTNPYSNGSFGEISSAGPCFQMQAIKQAQYQSHIMMMIT